MEELSINDHFRYSLKTTPRLHKRHSTFKRHAPYSLHKYIIHSHIAILPSQFV